MTKIEGRGKYAPPSIGASPSARSIMAISRLPVFVPTTSSLLLTLSSHSLPPYVSSQPSHPLSSLYFQQWQSCWESC